MQCRNMTLLLTQSELYDSHLNVYLKNGDNIYSENLQYPYSNMKFLLVQVYFVQVKS